MKINKKKLLPSFIIRNTVVIAALILLPPHNLPCSCIWFHLMAPPHGHTDNGQHPHIYWEFYYVR